MILHAIVIGLTLQGGQRLPGQGLTGEGAKLFQQVIKTPTGNNGYEEYVEAAALLRSDAYLAFQKFEQWVQNPNRFRQRDEQGRLYSLKPLDEKGEEIRVAPPEPPSGLTYDSTPLEVQQAMVQRFGGVLQLVERGNRKPVYQPRESIDLETLFPELAQFKEVTRLFGRKADCDLAAGNTSAAVNSLVEGLTFNRNLSAGPMINSLVGLAGTAIMLTSFDKGIGAFSLGDANVIAKACDRLLREPPPLLASIRQEIQHYDAIADSLFAHPQDIDKMLGSENKALTDQLERLSADQLRRVRDRTKALMALKRNEVEQLMNKSENDWHRSSVAELPVSQDPRDQTDALASEVVNHILPSYQQAFTSQGMRRAQLRCLRAAAKVIVFKWSQGRLPTKLEEAVSESEIEDPFSGGRLRYESPMPWAFRIESPGYGKSGPVGIRYRRAEPQDDEPVSGVRPPE